MTSDKGRDYAIRLHLPQRDPSAGDGGVAVIPAAMALALRFCRDGTSA